MGSETLLEQFVLEMSGFTRIADEALRRIESDPGHASELFVSYAEWMLAIRGTAQQLGYQRVSELAELGEELAVKASSAALTGARRRKTVGALWDALTTLRYVMSHPEEKSTEEQEFLLGRLNATLESLGGAREKISQDEIAALLASQRDL